MSTKEHGFSTAAVWAAEKGPFPFDAAVMPIVNAATFAYPELASWQAVATGKAAGHIYSRNTNPTVSVLEAKMAALDHTEAATAFATGKAAIAKGCDLVYLETPTNPTLKVVDISRLSEAAHKAGAMVAVDNTFSTPVN